MLPASAHIFIVLVRCTELCVRRISVLPSQPTLLYRSVILNELGFFHDIYDFLSFRVLTYTGESFPATHTHTHTHKETFFNDVKKREVTRLSGYTLWPFRSLKRRSLSNPFCLQVNAHYLSDWQSHDLIWLSLCARNYLNCDVIFELNSVQSRDIQDMQDNQEIVILFYSFEKPRCSW